MYRQRNCTRTDVGVKRRSMGARRPDYGRERFGGEPGLRNWGWRRLCGRSDCGPAAVLSLVESYESSSLFRMLLYVHVGLRGRAGMRGLCLFCTAFAGDSGSSFQWLRGSLSALRRRAKTGPRRRCIFSESVTFPFLGLLTREEEGQKGAKNVTKKCYNGDVTLLAKNRRKLRRRGSLFSS